MNAFRPLRIVHSEAATSFGGQEQYIFRMMTLMRERGHHLEAICQPQSVLAQRLQGEGFTVHTLLMDGPANFIRGVVRLQALLRRGRYDVLNSHSRRDTILVGCAARLAGTPLIVRTRHLAKRVGSLLSYTVIPHRVTTSSEFVRQHLIERGVKPAHVATVYPVMGLQEWAQPSTLRAELGLHEQDTIVGCVAALRAEKGHRALIDAMEPLLRDRENLHLVVVGGGSPVFEQLQECIADKNLGRQVHLMGPRDDVPNLMAGFDLFALATEQEAAGAVFVEAAQAGLAVVATKVGGVPEIVKEDVTGLLVPLHDQQALTHALDRLSGNPELRARMGAEARRRIVHEGQFSGEAMVRDIEAAYFRWLDDLTT